MMRVRSSLKPVLLMLRASAALALTATPMHLSFDGVGPKLTVASALADSDHSGSGGGGDHGGDRDSGGSDSSGHGGGGDDNDDHGGDDHSGPGGGGGDDDGNDDRSGPGGSGSGGSGRGGNDDGGDDEDHHVNRRTGDRVEIAGNDIEVIHADGTKEEIENGRFEMKDARGRTIVERRATRADINRLMALAR